MRCKAVGRDAFCARAVDDATPIAAIAAKHAHDVCPILTPIPIDGGARYVDPLMGIATTSDECPMWLLNPSYKYLYAFFATRALE